MVATKMPHQKKIPASVSNCTCTTYFSVHCCASSSQNRQPWRVRTPSMQLRATQKSLWLPSPIVGWYSFYLSAKLLFNVLWFDQSSRFVGEYILFYPPKKLAKACPVFSGCATLVITMRPNFLFRPLSTSCKTKGCKHKQTMKEMESFDHHTTYCFWYNAFCVEQTGMFFLTK